MTGLIVGAFVLPILLNKIGGSEPSVQRQAAAVTSPTLIESDLAAADAGTFIDQAVSGE